MSADPRTVPPQFMAALERLYTDQREQSVTASRHDWFSVVATVQLACRHPGFAGPTRDTVEKLARRLGQHLGKEDPVLAQLIEMGWQQKYDEPREAQ